MSNAHKRMLAAAQNFLTLSTDSFTFRKYLMSAQQAAAALGMLDFLAVDPDTPDEVRSRVKRTHEVARKRVSDSHLRWIRSRMEPRLSGRDDPESIAAEHVEALDEGFHEAVQAAIDEVGSE